jgi:hypothetical protein
MAHAGFDHVSPLRQFIGYGQRRAIAQACEGEEGQFFIDKLRDIRELIGAMPKTYEQDGMGDAAVVHLHYFVGGCDWYITEKDCEDEQLQAFGLADLGHGSELGYIAITEITRHGAELDLHFKPQTLGEIRAARAGR